MELDVSLLDRLKQPLTGLDLQINPDKIKVENAPYAMDVETDERDNFVGVGFYCGKDYIYYFTDLELAKYLFHRVKLIGHNIKADLHWLKKWDVPILFDNIVYDTMLASYCQNPTKEKHGLKSLTKEILGYEYPSYKELVGKGRNRITLDKHPLMISSSYNANDVVATYKLYQYFNRVLTPFQKSLFNNLEFPLMKLLFKMECLGVKVNIKYLRSLEGTFQGLIEASLKSLDVENINLNSPKQVKDWLRTLGIKLESTDKKNLVLQEHPKVKELLNYRELQKLRSTYIIPLQKEEVCHTTFSQLIDTGRLSSYNPNLQNIPTKTERGNRLRGVFIPDERNIFLDFDYSQIEYRLLAHFTQEPTLIKAYLEGKDIHEETARLLNCGRYIGKTCNFAAIYGAQGKKIAQTVNNSGEEKITKEEADQFLDTYWKKLPKVRSWIERIKEEARSKGFYRTLSGQRHYLTNIHSNDKLLRWHAERQAVNGTIQGSAAYIIKLAMLELEKLDIIPSLQVHDELLFQVYDDSGHIHVTTNIIKRVMENIVKLSVPLVVEVGVGKSWLEAKK